MTQLRTVRNKLKEDGFITRNYCLEMRITRLSAIIMVLKEEGWDLKGSWLKTEHGKDFKYEVLARPPLNKYQLFHLKMQNAD